MLQVYNKSYKDDLMSVCLDLPPARGNFDAFPANASTSFDLRCHHDEILSEADIQRYGISAWTHCKMPQKL